MLIKNKDGKWIYAPIEYGKSTEDNLIIYRFNRDLYYANSDLLRHQIIKLVKEADKPLKWFLLDTSGFEEIDYTSIDVLKEVHHELSKRNIKFVMIITVPQLRDQLEHLGLIKMMGEENVYSSVLEALEAFESENSY
ncbi:MAG: STAS domain-containing protein [Methanobacterium sp.]